jgi:hypothetical protein
MWIAMVGWADTHQAAGSGTFVLASWVFLRLLGLIYLAAFISLATQIKGLVGQRGILPVREFLGRHGRSQVRRFWRLPTLCWLNASDGLLLFLAWGGAALALLLMLGVATMPDLVLLWVFYLSLLTVCRIFLGYQWDILLLETGFLAIFLAPLELAPRFPPASAPPAFILWLLWWLLFRLMFSSGVAKLRSGDQAWRQLRALCYHYETQPLPTPIAWYAHQLPVWFHKFSATIMFAIELGAPFLIFAPPPLRYTAAAMFALLMVLIEVTGNYCFFNLLGLALSVLLLDDKLLLPVFRFVLPDRTFPLTILPPVRWFAWSAGTAAFLLFVLSLVPVLRLFRVELDWPWPVAKILQWLDPFRLANSYGLFSVMTIERPEIIVEGSADGVNWRAYEFKWKPGAAEQAPRFVAPHQPRLDWQMWFAALGYYEGNPWFKQFLLRLLEGSSDVLALLRHNPFPEAPPRFIQAMMYDYRFTDRAERRATRAWWRRERCGTYAPMLDLSTISS